MSSNDEFLGATIIEIDSGFPKWIDIEKDGETFHITIEIPSCMGTRFCEDSYLEITPGSREQVNEEFEVLLNRQKT